MLRHADDADASVESQRRTIGPELVDATQLDQWSAKRSAQDRLPELLRRLLASTPGVSDITVRAREGVSAPGWDGEATSTGSPFLPAGSLRFELSVQKDSKGKAQEDYDKRKHDADAKKEIFVFVTSRRWHSAADWVKERRADRHFADVKVLDADSLEGWLQQTPAVHHWISEELGRRPRDAVSLETWWGRLQGSTTPPLPAKLFLAGRDDAREELRDFLLGPPGIMVVRAPWQEDAIAFIHATIEAMAEGEAPQPPLVVRSAEVWDRVVPHPGRMTLVPLFDEPDTGTALQAGHHVVIPVDSRYAVSRDHIELPRPGRSEAIKALEEAGVDLATAYELAALARRSMPSLRRKLARSAIAASPEWIQPPDGPLLTPLVLAGSWTLAGADLEIVADLAGRQWPEIEQVLLRWKDNEDPPFGRAGDEWRLASPDEAFLLFDKRFTGDVLTRWHRVAEQVLLEADPKLELAPEDRPTASLQGAVRTYSPALRQGLAQGIALAGATGSDILADGRTAGDHARRLVRMLLRAAAADQTGRTWWALSEELRALAEASPEEFLDAVHEDLDRPEPILLTMFQDDDGSSALFGSSSHTGLLWALEVLCWSPDHMMEATLALAHLASIDPGGRLMNRPAASLASVLVGWIRQTSSSLELKMEALEQICSRYPEVGWKLVLQLWPDPHATASLPQAPRFRDWKPEERSVPMNERAEYFTKVIDLAIRSAAVEPRRWPVLVRRIGSLSAAQRDRLLSALAEFADPEQLDGPTRLDLWEALHREAARHRQFPDAAWSLDEETLSRLDELAQRIEPGSDPGRYAYLFDWHPDLPGLELGDQKYLEVLQEKRREAAATVAAEGGIDALRALTERVAAPGQLGMAVAVAVTDELGYGLLPWLASNVDPLKVMATSWAARRGATGGLGWLRETLGRSDAAGSEIRLQLALAAPARAETWDLLDEDSALAASYWEAVRPWGMESADVARATGELLGHDRPWAAVDVLNLAVRPEDGPEIDTALIETTLDAAIGADPSTGASQSPGYEVGVLLDVLEERRVPTEKLVRYEFLFFSLLDHYRQPRALYGALSEDPKLFVDLVSRVYRGKNQSRRKLDAYEEALALQAWSVLEHWRELPGDGDGRRLATWVQQARLLLNEADRADIGDEQIGRVLTASPKPEDGIWPPEPVRALIEQIGSQSLELGFLSGERNSRGITGRGVFDGGKQERDLAGQYRGWSHKTRRDWPRTARILRKLADAYEEEAREHDAEAEISGDSE